LKESDCIFSLPEILVVVRCRCGLSFTVKVFDVDGLKCVEKARVGDLVMVRLCNVVKVTEVFVPPAAKSENC
jgi:hypothetical protein